MPYKGLLNKITPLIGSIIIAPSIALATNVTNQEELDDAITNHANPIHIITGSLSMGSSLVFSPNTALGISNGASLSMLEQNQILGSLSGMGTIIAGTQLLTIGDNNLNTAFSGTIDFTGETWDVTHGSLIKTGSGALTIDGALISLGESIISQGSLIQTSGATAINTLSVGNNLGHDSLLNVSGGTLTFRTALQVGNEAGLGVVNQMGGSVILSSSCGDPSHCSFLTIGHEGGEGVYNMQGGSLALSGSMNSIGRSSGANPGSHGTLNMNGGLVELSGLSALILGLNNGSEGTINQTGGLLRVNNGATLYLAGTDGAGIYNLNGGVLEIGGNSLRAGYNNSTPDYQFNLGGGTLKVIGTSLVSQVNATLMSNTMSSIDTNGLNAQWEGTLSGGGGLAKMGNGTFTQLSQGTYFGETLIKDGIFTAGASNVLAPNSAFSIAAAATLNLNHFDNTIGSLAGAGHVAAGTAHLTNGNDGTSTTFAGTIDGSGELTKTGLGTLTLTGNNASFTGTTTLNGGALVINNVLGGVLNTAAETLLRGNGEVRQTATINGYIQPGSTSVGTLTFNGNYIQGSGSTYNVDVVDAQQYNTIQVAGSATINDAAQVNLIQHDRLPINTTLSILHANGGVVGQYSHLLADDRLFLDVALTYDVNDVYLSILRNAIPLSHFAVTPNQVAVADAIDRYAYLNPNNPLYLAVVNLNDPRILPSVFNALSGQIHAAAIGTYVEESRYLRDTVLNRLDSLRLDTSASAGGSNHPGFWMEGYGAWGKMNTPSNNTASLTRNNSGLFLGLDTPVFEQSYLGMVAGFGETHLDMPTLRSTGNSHNAYLGLYSRTTLAKATGYLGASYAWHHLNTQRFVDFPGVENVLNASYQAPTQQIFAEVKYDLYAHAFDNISPFAQAAYVHVNRSAFNETGGVSALTGFKATDDMPYSTTGLKMNSRLGRIQELTIDARTVVGWQHAYFSIYPHSSFAFAGGSAFLITGVPIAQNAALIDAAIDVRVKNDNLHLLFGYLSQLSRTVQDNGLQGSIRYRFI